MTAFALPAWLSTIVVTTLTLGLTLRGAVPRGRRRRVRGRVLLRALLPRRLLRSRSSRLDICAFLFNTFVAGLIIGGLIASAMAWVSALTPLAAHLPALPAHLPPFVASVAMTAAMYLAFEASYWLNHWLSHRIGWLWAFHKVHHTAESLSFFTNYRVHPVDTVVFYNMSVAAAAATGVAMKRLLGPGASEIAVGDTNALLFLASFVLSYLQHTHLWLATTGRWGRWLLSPAHHQYHHSADPRHHGHNLGSTLALFDRLAGTLLVPTARREPLRFGAGDLDHDPHSLQGAMLHPFVEAATSLMPVPRPAAPPAFGTAAQRRISV